ncbi:outer membrane protein assembly factor BamB [Agitococcus lubricus]|uniref:Outer membrane protein assembly factor BamB n=1 Tax=Agitococcus lubricus TaxID=1077255 RepID=A0A2T5J2S9_9GAMM|nr:outer membrane protein assembly factor BamB [Agitococcus lubricus]PTQ90825.1 Beta-barrel assembly machine subunit BamB [Agitococcus lubricus]
MKRHLSLVLTLCVVAACSSNPNEHKPSPLPPLPTKKEQVFLKRVWKQTVGDGVAKDAINLRMARQNQTLFVASRDGVIAALDDQGKIQWQQKTKLPLTGGLSAGYGILVMATSKGELRVLSATDGQLRWQKKLLAPVLAPAALTADTLIVQSNDGKVYGLDLQTGEQRWVYDVPVPSLSLRGYASPLVVDQQVLIATSSAKVVSLEAKTGIPQWESRVSVNNGRSELARIADIDADMRYEEGQLYVVGYQGQLAALSLDGDKAKMRWQAPMSSYQTTAIGTDYIFVVDADSTVWALSKNSGEVVWKQTLFAWRGLSNPVTVGDYLIVGDQDGYLHVMTQKEGKLLGRQAISGAVVNLSVHDKQVLAYGAEGQISAWQFQP